VSFLSATGVRLAQEKYGQLRTIRCGDCATPSLNICLVTDSLEIGGAERHVVDLARALAGRGYSVTVASASGGPLAASLAGSSAIASPLLGHTVKRSVSLSYVRALRALLARRRFDLVHAHVYASQAAAALALLGTGVPLVMTEHSQGSWQGRKEMRVVRWYASQAGRIIGVSDGICRRLTEDLGVDAGRVTHVANAVPAFKGAVHRDKPAQPSGSGRVIAVVGRLCAEKGHATFLEAVACAVPASPDTRFLIVGGGKLLGALRAQARALGVADRVEFLGPCPDGPALIASVDLLVVPSLSEGSPLVVLEALAAGVPVLASRAGGTRIPSTPS
jgi:glycosyltransferase involved in cell wall biosynthesis